MAPSSVPTDSDATAMPTSLQVAAGGVRLALDLDVLLEAGSAGPLTPVPGAAKWFAGLGQWHGHLVTVVDAGQLFGHAPSRCRWLLALRGLACDVTLGVDELNPTPDPAQPQPRRLDLATLRAHPAFAPGAAGRPDAGRPAT
jgi:hypothetical protein